MKQGILSSIAVAFNLDISHAEPVSGGDINQAYCVYAGDTRYFLKMNDAERFPMMFEKEADGLNALRAKSRLLVPELIQYGMANDKQWLLLQWLKKEKTTADTMQNFGAAMAKMHQQTGVHFGWHTHNYIGSLKQVNTLHTEWTSFYSQCRLLPLVKVLFDTGLFSKEDCRLAEACCARLGSIFPKEPPALLHGDLWSGNYMITKKGVAVFDPAVYYGHREMDIGMTTLFGGFSRSFYDAYLEVYPLENGWQKRLAFAQLYPILVHAVLFGGHYVESARQVLKRQG